MEIKEAGENRFPPLCVKYYRTKPVRATPVCCFCLTFCYVKDSYPGYGVLSRVCRLAWAIFEFALRKLVIVSRGVPVLHQDLLLLDLGFCIMAAPVVFLGVVNQLGWRRLLRRRHWPTHCQLGQLGGFCPYAGTSPDGYLDRINFSPFCYFSVFGRGSARGRRRDADLLRRTATNDRGRNADLGKPWVVGRLPLLFLFHFFLPLSFVDYDTNVSSSCLKLV